jgi:hypothetical protein
MSDLVGTVEAFQLARERSRVAQAVELIYFGLQSCRAGKQAYLSAKWPRSPAENPSPGAHADYVKPRWRQVVGSTMHCVAGDGIGILIAAAIFSTIGAPEWLNLLAEYILGFAFGWTIFQSLFMRDMAGGSYRRSLRMTFLPEFVSMNGVMAGMIALSVPWRQSLGPLASPTHPQFWFIMSISLTLGFAVTYPLNWWLVSAGLKHGMTTTQNQHKSAQGMNGPSPVPRQRPSVPVEPAEMAMSMPPSATTATKTRMIITSLAVLATGATIAGTLGSPTTR